MRVDGAISLRCIGNIFSTDHDVVLQIGIRGWNYPENSSRTEEVDYEGETQWQHLKALE